jgi:hypothetical protein
MELVCKWEEVLAFDTTACAKLQALKSLTNNQRLVSTYRSLRAGAVGLSSPGSWTLPAIRAAFSPLQTLVVVVKSFGVDWRIIAADFENIGLDFYSLFTGPGIEKEELESTEELEEGGN